MTIQKVKEEILLDNGKYRWVLYDNYASEIFRHGELWKDTCGDKFLLSAMQEILDLREELDAAVECVDNSSVGWDEIREISE